ncbi:MAG: plasmid mobilization relaxosome protein MobC [Pseudomonadota bacterium]
MPRIEKRLTVEQKEAWKAFCQKNNQKESDMLGLMLQKIMASQLPIQSGTKSFPKSEKITVRLSEKDHAAIQQRAQQEGYANRTAWLNNLVQLELNNQAIFTQEEVNALRESNRELAAIGRNLNQIAKALNAQLNATVTQHDILKLSSHIDAHREKVSRVVHKSLNYKKDIG